MQTKFNLLYQYLNELTNFEIIKCLLSGIIGLLICIFTSAIVNTTLVEISLNMLFAFYFGICFVTIGVLLTMRIQSLQDDIEMNERKPFLFLFACLVLISGIFCFFLDENWVIILTPLEKAPLYIIISMSLNFCVIFSIVDLMNYFLGFFQKSNSKTIVETPKQIVVSLVLSVTMGLFYGIIFSIFDLEDQRGRQLDSQLIQDEYYCIPIAGFLGFIGGFINELLRIKGDYIPIIFQKNEDPFNEEI